jgi:hypothetical protein
MKIIKKEDVIWLILIVVVTLASTRYINILFDNMKEYVELNTKDKQLGEQTTWRTNNESQ